MLICILFIMFTLIATFYVALLAYVTIVHFRKLPALLIVINLLILFVTFIVGYAVVRDVLEYLLPLFTGC